MTVYQGVSNSNFAEVTDVEKAKEVLEELEEYPETYFITNFYEGQLRLQANAGTVHLPEHDDFFSKLAEILEEPLMVRSVGYEGLRYRPDAWQVTVFPDGEYVFESLTDDPEKVRSQSSYSIKSVGDDRDGHYYEVEDGDIEGVTVNELDGEITIHS
jgi:hypothetical protein